MHRFITVTLGLLVALCLSSAVQSGDKGKKKPGIDMRVPFTPLWQGDAPDAKGKESADIPGVYVYPAKNPTGPAIVVCPGGGYGGHALGHEGAEIADWLNSHGITAFVVKYRLGAKYNHPTPLNDAHRAIRFARDKAKEFKFDTKRVGILGFSAGGHLASTTGTHDRPVQQSSDPIDNWSSRPDFMVLMYPVITLTGPFAHNGSRINLLGKNPDAKLVDSLCNHTQVTKDTPPTFLVHTSEDTGVPPQNSTLFYDALVKNKVPAEMHIYEKGRHGLGLGPKELPYSSWPDRCVAWMKSRGILN